ncbi:UNKNOWN [Stylonychia lemnae]|uniref:Uncharacterized protein n=1 Tax=Stylonychia lemnae TaxID=5949 RepID=A0A078AAR9_STYLE|nr:UNKNOWN [Stylonychia lemnae]|eukprot:CDW78697.1 UNKNOWN [Stylonychia lemnae]
MFVKHQTDSNSPNEELFRQRLLPYLLSGVPALRAGEFLTTPSQFIQPGLCSIQQPRFSTEQPNLVLKQAMFLLHPVAKHSKQSRLEVKIQEFHAKYIQPALPAFNDRRLRM